MILGKKFSTNQKDLDFTEDLSCMHAVPGIWFLHPGEIIYYKL